MTVLAVSTRVLYLGIIACGCAERLEPSPNPLGKAQSVNPDHEILDAVLLALIVNKEFDPAVGGRGVQKSDIVVEDLTDGLSDRILRRPPCDATKAIPEECRVDILARNPKGKRYSLRSYDPASPHILVADLRSVDLDMGFDVAFPDARGYVRPYLPGYSRDGQTAIMFFAFGPTSHGAVGYCLLSRATDRWCVVWSCFWYFN